MKKTLLLLPVALFALAGCQGEEPAPPEQPEVEVKTMEEIGKLTPEQEAAQIRQQDQRPQEDKEESGL